jgi:hypothetical protein
MPRVACCIDILRVAESFLNTVLEIGGARKSMARSPLSIALSRLFVPLIAIIRTLIAIIRTPHRDHPYPLLRLSVPLIAIIRTLTLVMRWLALARLQVHAPQETSPLLRAHGWSPKHTVRTAPQRPTRTHSRTADDPTPPTAAHAVADQCRT